MHVPTWVSLPLQGTGFDPSIWLTRENTQLFVVTNYTKRTMLQFNIHVAYRVLLKLVYCLEQSY